MKKLRNVRRARTLATAGVGVILVAIVGAVAFIQATSDTPHAPGTVSAPTLAPSSTAAVYVIDPSGTTASFTIGEVLFGQPNTVVGKTNQVAGQIALDTATPTKSQVGTIKVDLTTLKTDNDRRNGAIQNFILETNYGYNQYATFAPTSIQGLPKTITSGQPVRLTIVGNLTIHNETNKATFSGTVTLSSANVLTGHLQTTVDYTTYGISLPSVPFVTGVGNLVALTLDFTAHPEA